MRPGSKTSPVPSLLVLSLLVLPCLGAVRAAEAQEGVPTPASHLGFEPGTDGRLASWDALVSYYRELARTSDRVQVEELGRTHRDNPFLLLTISSPENLARKERLREISLRMADPRGLGEEEEARLAEEGRAVVAVTTGLHSTEVAAAQMAPLLAWELATGDDPETLRILDEVVFLFFPSFNPDGHQAVVEWVDETRGTRWAGSRLPDMYHEYVGHDNNRDGYMLTQPEARYFARVVYREWIPQMYLDVHQMGSYGPRLYLPPYDDPINPKVDPLNWIQHQGVGSAMQEALELAGITGVSTGTYYTGFWFPSFHMVTNHHNIAGMLTESASANMAEPLYIHPEQLRPQGRKMDLYGTMQVFPHPWPGGWWRVSDIIEQQRVSTRALLSHAAKDRVGILRSMAFKARRTLERGRTEPPLAFVIPAEQHDPLTGDELVHLLMANGVEVHRAREGFRTGDRVFDAGDWVVLTAQPNGVLVRSLLQETPYPDDATTREPDGTIIPPYDLANFVVAEHMGVRAVPLEAVPDVGLEEVAEPPRRPGGVTGTGSAGWVLSHATNAAFSLTNAVLARGGSVYWMKEPLEVGGRTLAPGALWIPAEGLSGDRMAEMAREASLEVTAVAEAPAGAAWRLRPLRMGMYRRFLGEQLDEGWTRFIFDRWGFPYERVEADGVREGALADLDVFLIPHDGPARLRGEGNAAPPGEGDADEYPETFLPPRYREGLDDEAYSRLKAWVRGGGTLVLLGDATEVAWRELGVPVRNAVEGIPREEYFSPGSNLRARFDTSHPLAYGMPEEALVLNWGSPVYRIGTTPFNGRISVPVAYGEGDILASGWLEGEEHIAGMPAALDVEYGEGRILMIGFRSQHRAQTHGTFKVFFNALYYGSAGEVVLGGR